MCLDGTSICAPKLPLTPHRADWLCQLDEDDSPLRQFLAARNQSPRLGLLFESLWHFFLDQDPETELLCHNFAVRQQGRTLGEFDVIYRCLSSEQTIHLELAVKFYLYVPSLHNAAPYTGWLGPNQADRLDKKIHRLVTHQLPLSTTEAAQQSLQAAGICVDKRQLQLSGRLFRHRRHTAEATEDFLTDHPQGEWMTVSEFMQWGQRQEWRYLAKPDWLGATFQQAEALTLRHLNLARARPIMLTHPSGGFLFLCPDLWQELGPVAE